MTFISRPLFGITLWLLVSTAASAQHHDHGTGADSAGTDLFSGQHAGHTFMSHAFSRNLPMSRNASGTSWLPDDAPMYGIMQHAGDWMFMYHGNLFLRYNSQDIGGSGSRGDEMFDLPNWFMGMGQRPVGERGLFRFSAMLSLDPLTVGGEGYPLLFQSGESWEGVPLVDRQHPHDLFSELSFAYTHMLSKNSDFHLYLGYPGEPAFGPPAFMHRPSALYNPDAPIGHHWQDATHITFGVATAGLRLGPLKLEGSLFTGREPNEERYGFDRPRFDSWSARLSWNPSRSWALQLSRAGVKDVHATGPREDVDKTTVSAIHTLDLGDGRYLSSTAVWGHNDPTGHHTGSHAFLLESVLRTAPVTLFGKWERVEKSTGDLQLDEEAFGHEKLFAIHALTLGLQRDLAGVGKLTSALGLQGTLYGFPKSLEAVYGQRPVSAEIYLRLYPSRM